MTNHSVHQGTCDRAVANIQRLLDYRDPVDGVQVDCHLAAARLANIDLVGLPFHPLDDCLTAFCFETHRGRFHLAASYQCRVAQECGSEDRTPLLAPSEEVEVHLQVPQGGLEEGVPFRGDLEVLDHCNVEAKRNREEREIRTERRNIVVGVVWDVLRTVTSGDRLTMYLHALFVVCSICRPSNEKIQSPWSSEGGKEGPNAVILEQQTKPFGKQNKGDA